ncbi:hypothetical protein HBZS_105080 [Helicobacter bizzozeronii CCUG 35545]|nr:hypothetical protein HBZS_105080 [Helicobacter bizzozeronii CCUG 35545]
MGYSPLQRVAWHKRKTYFSLSDPLIKTAFIPRLFLTPQHLHHRQSV